MLVLPETILSTTSCSLRVKRDEFVGLRNYSTLIRSDRFWNAVRINWIVVIASIVLQLSVSLSLAIVLSKKGRGMKVYRTAAFAPQVLSIAAVGMIWGLLYDPFQGLINEVLNSIGFEGVHTAWLGNTNTALIAMLVTSTWFYYGFHIRARKLAVRASSTSVSNPARSRPWPTANDARSTRSCSRPGP